MPEKLDILRSTNIFSRLSADDLGVIADYSRLREYPAGSTVFSDGDPGEELFIISAGEISILRHTREDKTIELARFIDGDLFGEMAFFQNAPRNAIARAEKDSLLLEFPRDEHNFNDFLLDHPAISAQLLHSFLTIIAGRIRSTNKLVTENSPLVQELRKQMYGDKLTGQYNRTYLEEQLHTYFRGPEIPVSLLMVKPDNFKYINDNYGHDAGDQTLRILGSAYGKTVGDEDCLVRFMGNEFGFVKTGMDKTAARDFAQTLQQLAAELDLSELIGEDPFHLTLSIGIAVYPEYGTDASEIIAAAHELPLIGRGRGGGKVLFPEDKDPEPKE